GAVLLPLLLLISPPLAAVSPPVKSASAVNGETAGPPELSWTAPGGGGGGGVVLPDRISMPLTWALSLTVVKWIVNLPELSAGTVNCSTTALSAAPAAATMSKLVSTCLPLILTLKTRWPAAVQ